MIFISYSHYVFKLVLLDSLYSLLLKNVLSLKEPIYIIIFVCEVHALMCHSADYLIYFIVCYIHQYIET